MPKKLLPIIAVLCHILSMISCASKPKTETPVADTRIQDERTFPQDLMFYAKKIGPNKELLTASEQNKQEERFRNRFFGPWFMTRCGISKKEACLQRTRGYKLGGERWPQFEWNKMVQNCNMDSFPSRHDLGITLRQTDLREMPTHKPRYDKPITNAHSYPFDDFQYSQLSIGTPIFIAHTSADGRWVYAECALAGGWIDANDVAVTDQAFRNQWLNAPLCAITQEKVHLGNYPLIASIGTTLPLLSENQSTLTVALPMLGNNGLARSVSVQLPKSAAQRHPLPLTPHNVAKLGNKILKQPYGWGGMYGLRDCSAMTHDLLAPFGIWLPRNSRAQAKTGAVVSLSGLSMAEKEKCIQSRGTPFLSLVGLPGHITMYVGKHKDRCAILHNTWGVRTIEGNNNNARHVIGRTVITSITPGLELPNLYRKKTFVDHIHALATPGK